MLRPITLVLFSCALGACVPRPTPPPPPEPVGQVPTPARPAPLPPPPPVAWEDAAITPGDWMLRTDGAPSALFGQMGQGARFFARCEGGQVLIGRAGAGPDRLTVRTSYGVRTLPAGSTGDGTAARLPASDPLLDQIAFSRGRFAVEMPGAPLLIMPSWPEIARVTEDCRS